MKLSSWFDAFQRAFLFALPLLLSPLDSFALKYAAIGASDATGVGAIPITNGYVYQIRDRIDETGADLTLVNLGIPGATTRTMQRLEVPLARLAKPDLITVLAGPNDITRGRSVGSFRSDFNKLLRGLRRAGGTMYVATSPDLTKLPKYQANPNSSVTPSRMRAFNKVIADYSARYGAALVDLYTQPITGEDVAQDGFHPSNDGHQKIADAFWAHIEPGLQ